MGFMESYALLTDLVPESLLSPTATPVNPGGLAAWVNHAVEVYTLELRNGEKIYLIVPKMELAFKQVVIVVDQVRKHYGGLPLLVADDLDPRFRSLFVKKRIPYIYKNQSLYFPELGLKILDFKKSTRKASQIVSSSLGAFELKLLSGYLTGFFEDAYYNLNDILAVLGGYNYRCSKTKLSATVNKLLSSGYLEAHGAGPNRKVQFQDRDEVWANALESAVGPFLTTYETTLAIDDSEAILSHESALAGYSNLASPKKPRFALSRSRYRKLESQSIASRERTVVVDVFKEPPELFAIDQRFLNPVELFFQMRTLGDERIQLSLEEMLTTYHLHYPKGD